MTATNINVIPGLTRNLLKLFAQNRLIKTGILLVMFFIGGPVLAQPVTDIQTLKPWQLKSYGKNAQRVGDYYSAIDFYERYLELKPEKHDYLLKLADMYRKSRDYEKAEEAYLKVFNLDPSRYLIAQYYYALMLKMNGKYDESRVVFDKFMKDYKGAADAGTFKKIVANEIAGIDLAKKIIPNPEKVLVTHLDTSINKAHAELSPIPMPDGTMLYASLRTDSMVYYFPKSDTFSMPLRKFYTATRNGNDWKGGVLFEGPFNSDSTNVGNGSFSPDGNKFYFTKCKQNWQGIMVCAIYVSKLQNGNWQEPVKIDENMINNPKISATQPTATTESKKKQEVIYFVSDRPGGKGGLDIWYTLYDAKKDKYSAPKNAGKINTPGDEMTPFWDKETRNFYFSSDGWPSIGGLDVFKVNGELTKWSTPTNVGYPLNSSADDIYYSIHKSQEDGFLVSNREGGIALKNPTCCDDIYGFKFTQFIHLALTGNVFEQNDTANIQYLTEKTNALDIVADSAGQNSELNSFEASLGDTTNVARIANAIVSVYTTDNENNEILVKTDSTNSEGKYFIKLQQGNNYRIVFNKPGYFNRKLNFSTKSVINSDTLHRSVSIRQIPRQPIIVKNIYYPFDKSYLTDTAKLVIDTTIYPIMLENQEIVVEISSHTDSKGADAYNEKLSQERAQSVVNHLISKGIDKDRLVAKGYGEFKPLADNENPDGSDNPEGRQMNRRTEFKVIGIMKKYSDVIYEE